MVTMCMRCKEPFNALTRRRHHCRACGYVSRPAITPASTRPSSAFPSLAQGPSPLPANSAGSHPRSPEASGADSEPGM